MNLKLVSLLGIIAVLGTGPALADKNYAGGKKTDAEEMEKRGKYKYGYKNRSGGTIVRNELDIVEYPAPVQTKKKKKKKEEIPDALTRAELDETIQALNLSSSGEPISIAVSENLTINLEIEFDDDEDFELQPAAVKISPFDRAIADMMAGNAKYKTTNICGKPDKSRCPFATEKECGIWRAKPSVDVSGEAQNRAVEDNRLCRIISELRAHRRVPAQGEAGRALIPAHRALMDAGRKCCMNSMANAFRAAGLSDSDVANFEREDATGFRFTERCLTISRANITQMTGGGWMGDAMLGAQSQCYSGTSAAHLAKLLAPFVQLFETAPDLKQYPLDYTFTDSRGRRIRMSITHDVFTIADRLNQL
jgi:hypothetical protein